MFLPSAQKGVALITALLIVAMATIISVELSTRLQLDIRRTGNVVTSEQALLHLKFAERFARRVLTDDHNNNQHDSLDEIWAEEVEVPVEGGRIVGQLTDLQACFNLNSLVQNNQPDALLAQDRFRRLMSRLPHPPSSDLSPAIIDWIDADVQNNTPADGAEDSYYHNLEWPYRSANQPMKSISELRLIKGFEDHQIIQETAGLLCAFGPATDINVNTAPEEVLESLAAGISPTIAEDIVTNRKNKPYETMNNFLTTNNLSTIVKNTKGLSISSDYFLLTVTAEIGQSRTLMYSIIYRDNTGNTEVLSRSQGAY